MKKTLLGVLAFVLVLATVLTGTVLAADTDADTLNVGAVKMVDADHPIKVDGKMDEAYTTAIALPLMTRTANEKDVYTHGYARFVWSKAENALYCHVIINDAEFSPSGNYPWESDSVEMFIDFSCAGTQSWGVEGLSGDGAVSRGLQYRIDGFKGTASCYLLEENPADTYLYDEDAGRFVNKTNKLINDKTNIFGWTHSDDVTKTGWGYQDTTYGYMVEFRIDPKEQGVTLADGLTFAFDFQINDRYGVDAAGVGRQNNFYYSSTYRLKTGTPSAGNVATRYDTMTLSDDVATNSYSEVADAKLAEYGMADASLPIPVTTASTERTYTSKVTIDRVFTTRKGGTGSSSTTENNGTTAPSGGDNGTTAPSGGDNGTTAPAAPGGCGGSVALGSSLAMLAIVGATGFFAFRRKDEE